VEKLQRLQLPVLASATDLAAALNITIPRLRWLAFHSEAATVTHYVRFQVPKKSGGMRELAAPHRDLAAAQQWILMHILEKIPTHDAAHGFVPGRGTMSNAVPHVGRATVVNLDLKDFFPSITFPRVKGIFQDLGFSPAVATILGLLCTECPRRQLAYGGKTFFVASGPRGLPQGACTSPALSNLLARRLDSRLAGLAKKLGFTYTRYADDLTFSADGAAAAKTGYLLARVRHIVAGESLIVNESKTRIQRPGRRQTVTGIVVNKRPNVPRRVAKRLRAILHHAKKEGLSAQNREHRENFEHWLGGMIAYVQMVNPTKGKRLRDAYKSVSG
jgi:retron-type reverse transcriptase